MSEEVRYIFVINLVNLNKKRQICVIDGIVNILFIPFLTFYKYHVFFKMLIFFISFFFLEMTLILKIIF